MVNSLLQRRALAGLLLFFILLAGCNDLELESAWRDRDILIDGDATDWRGLTTYVEKGNIAVGVVNDRQDMYVCLHSPTREVAGQIVLRGLTVWFEPEGGSEGSLGIRCPMGADEPPGFDGRGEDRDRMREKIVVMVEEASRRVELLGPDNLVYGTFAPGDIRGLEIALGYEDGRMVYELKLPLEPTEESPYALDVDWNRKVSINFLTPEFDMDAMREEMGEPMGGGPPGGRGARGSGMGGGGMRGGGMRMEVPEPLELRCRASLASPRDETAAPGN